MPCSLTTARACDKEGRGKSLKSPAGVAAASVGAKPVARGGKTRAELGTLPLPAEPTTAEGLVGACRLRWCAAILERAARRGELRALRPLLALHHTTRPPPPLPHHTTAHYSPLHHTARRLCTPCTALQCTSPPPPSLVSCIHMHLVPCLAPLPGELRALPMLARLHLDGVAGYPPLLAGYPPCYRCSRAFTSTGWLDTPPC